MTHLSTSWPFHQKVLAAACALGIAALSLAGAQDPAAKAPADDPFGKKADGPKDAKDAKGTIEAKAALDRNRIRELLKEDPLALRHVRESNPTTPEQLAKAAEIALNFDSVAESKEYLKKFLEAKPDDATLASLAVRLGSDLFLRLRSEKEIQP